MRRFSESHNYAHERVPEAEHVSAVSLIFVLVGLMLTLPVFVLAGEVLLGLGLVRGAIAFAISGMLLTVLATFTGLIGVNSRLTTYAILVSAFGEAGSKAPAAVLAFLAVGWFGFTIGFFADALNAALQASAGMSLPRWVCAMTGGAVMTGTVLFGFRGIAALNRFAVPLLAALLIWAVARLLVGGSLEEMLRVPGCPSSPVGSVGGAVSVILGAVAALAGGMPDLTRFAKSEKDVILANAVSFSFGAFVLCLMAGAPAVITGSADFSANLLQLGMGWPAIAVVILATWTTNVVNLYASSLSLARIAPDCADWRLTAGAGCAGTIFAVAGATTHYVDLLMILSVLIPPIAGVYIAHYLLTGEAGAAPRIGVRFIALAGWIAGAAVGAATAYSGLVVTGAPAVDALLAGCLAYSLMWCAARAGSLMR